MSYTVRVTLHCDGCGVRGPSRDLALKVIIAAVNELRAAHHWSYRAGGDGATGDFCVRCREAMLRQAYPPLGSRWMVVETGGGESDFGRNEEAARANFASRLRAGQRVRLVRLDPVDVEPEPSRPGADAEGGGL